MEQSNFFTELENFEQIPKIALTEISQKENKDILSHTLLAPGEGSQEPAQEQTTSGNTSDFSNTNRPGIDTPLYTGQRLNLGSIFDAKLGVSLLDTIIPTLLVIVMRRSANVKISKTRFSLSASEKETIQPVLQNYLNSINFSVDNPLNALLITVGVIYGSKTLDVFSVEVLEKTESDKPVNIYSDAPKKTRKPGSGRPRKNF